MAIIVDPQHNFRQCYFSWMGIDLTSGLAEDNAVVFNINSELATLQMDAAGRSGSISSMGDNSGTVELTYNTQSQTNILLNNIVRQEKLNGGTKIVGNMEIIGDGTAFLYQPKHCFISTRPSQSIGKDMVGNTQTWIFTSLDMNPVDVDDYVLSIDAKAFLTANVNVAVSISL